MKKTLKIGNKNGCDITKDEYILELNNLNIYNVNLYDTELLWSKIKTFVE